jgi:hypothetical protein
VAYEEVWQAQPHRVTTHRKGKDSKDSTCLESPYGRKQSLWWWTEPIFQKRLNYKDSTKALSRLSPAANLRAHWLKRDVSFVTWESSTIKTVIP